jgi:chitin disaccharide deacetylase
MRETLSFALCADDYAMTPGVSAGIIEALDAGALSAVSVMTTSPWWDEAAPALLQRQGRADIGLHLNLTLGAPLGTMPVLAHGGTLPDVRRLLRLQRSGRLPLDEIAEQISRQCDRFFAAVGRAPDHVDGHQHVHALRQIRPLLLTELERRGWRPWIRDSSDQPWRLAWRGGARKAFVVSLLSEGHASALDRRAFRHNEGFAGYSNFDPAADYAALFVSYLRRPGPRHLVMCHPGYADDALRCLDPVVETREQELRFLTSGLNAVLARQRATLTRLSTMLPSSAAPRRSPN